MTVAVDQFKTGDMGQPFAGSFTWAGKPSATSFSAGTRIRITDYGVPCLMMETDGTRWVPAGIQVLARSAVAASAAADTNENTLATVTIPAGLLGLNSGLLVFAHWTTTNSANNKVARVKLGTTNLYSSTTTTNTHQQTHGTIRNRNSASSQFASFWNGRGTDSVPNILGVATGAEDTSGALNLLLTGQKASAGETLTLEGYHVHLMP